MIWAQLFPQAGGEATGARRFGVAAAFAAGLLLAACAGGSGGPIGPAGPASLPGVREAVGPKPGLTPPALAGKDLVRVGLVLPFSTRQQDAEGFYNAAELALFDQGGDAMLLIPRDAGADGGAAADAVRDLVRDGADIILGPVLRDQVAGAGRAARGANVPVIGFSTDQTVAGDGVYLLSFPLEEEVVRIIDYAMGQGLRSFALLAPEGEYGARVETVMRRRVMERQGTLALVRTYARNDRDASVAALGFAPEASAAGVQAVLIADGGATLRAVGPALVRGGLNSAAVRLLGTSAWAGDAAKEPTLAGGWFAAADPAARQVFESRYAKAFGQPAPRLASLAYDGVALTALMARDVGRSGVNRNGIERETGVIGVDGLFRFRRNGTIERSLAVLEVRPGGPVVIDAAAKRFAGPSS